MKRVILLLTFFSSLAHADLHLKGFLGGQGFEPDSYNGQLAANNIHRVYASGMWGGDAVFELGRLGIGARYIKSSIKTTGTAGVSSKLSVTSLTGLLMFELFGGKVGGLHFVGTYGAVSDASVASENSGTVTTYKSKDQMALTLGAQGLLKLKRVLLFTEGGYQKLEIDKLRNGATSANFKVDMEGMYYLFGVGLVF